MVPTNWTGGPATWTTSPRVTLLPTIGYWNIAGFVSTVSHVLQELILIFPTKCHNMLETASARSSGFIKANETGRLNQTALAPMSQSVVRSFDFCSASCMNTRYCNSFDFNRVNGSCFLFPATAAYVPGSFISDRDYWHYDMILTSWLILLYDFIFAIKIYITLLHDVQGISQKMRSIRNPVHL